MPGRGFGLPEDRQPQAPGEQVQATDRQPAVSAESPPGIRRPSGLRFAEGDAGVYRGDVLPTRSPHPSMRRSMTPLTGLLSESCEDSGGNRRGPRVPADVHHVVGTEQGQNRDDGAHETAPMARPTRSSQCRPRRRAPVTGRPPTKHQPTFSNIEQGQGHCTDRDERITRNGRLRSATSPARSEQNQSLPPAARRPSDARADDDRDSGTPKEPARSAPPSVGNAPRGLTGTRPMPGDRQAEVLLKRAGEESAFAHCVPCHVLLPPLGNQPLILHIGAVHPVPQPCSERLIVRS